MSDSAESTPTTEEPRRPGALKYDQGKPRLGLVLGDFADALIQVGEVGTFGANKYSAHGWKYVENAFERYENAMLRHWFKHKKGLVYDEESQISHLAHMAWNALALLSFQIRNQHPTPPNAKRNDTLP